MAENSTTLSNNLHSYYQKMLLETAEKELKFRQFGNDKLMQKGMGTDYKILRYGNIAASTTALTEGVVPPATTVDTNRYTCTAAEYGQHLQITQWVNMIAIDPVLESVVDRLSYTAAQSVDKIIRDHLVSNATTNLQYVGTGNTTDDNVSATETFVLQDVVKAVRILKGTDAPALKGGEYAWLIHSYISQDIMLDTSAGGFQDLNKYVSGLAEKPLNGEIGKGYGARIVESNNVSSAANASTVNVYRTFVFAKDPFVVTKFDKDMTRIIVKQAGQSGIVDPLDQLSTAGYKIQMGVKYIGGDFTGANSGSPDLAIQIRGAATGG